MSSSPAVKVDFHCRQCIIFYVCVEVNLTGFWYVNKIRNCSQHSAVLSVAPSNILQLTVMQSTMAVGE